MTSGVSTYRFKLANKTTRNRLMKKREMLIEKLGVLQVKVNKPTEMAISDLEMLVNYHRKTVEASENHVTKEHLAVAESKGISQDDVYNRVNDLGWDTANAIRVKKSKRNRKQKNQERKLLLQQINRLELLGEDEKVFELERELAKL